MPAVRQSVMEPRPRLVAVMYHYVRDTWTTTFPDIKAVSIAQFRQQVALVRERFLMPRLENCIEFLEGRWDPRQDICILTFDDGLREHHDTVADILTDAGMFGAFFVPTAAVEHNELLPVHMNHFLLASLGTPMLRKHLDQAAKSLDIEIPCEPPSSQVRAVYRWDSEDTARLKYLVNHLLSPDLSEALLQHVFSDVLGPPEEFARSLYLDWDQAREMQTAGFALGGHSHSHRILSGMEDGEQREDLEQSMSLLRSRLGGGHRGFAYPYGKPSTYTEMTISQLSDLGYSCAFNTTADHSESGVSRWEIPRIDPKDI